MALLVRGDWSKIKAQDAEFEEGTSYRDSGL